MFPKRKIDLNSKLYVVNYFAIFEDEGMFHDLANKKTSLYEVEFEFLHTFDFTSTIYFYVDICLKYES